jgi:hypothetical protein
MTPGGAEMSQRSVRVVGAADSVRERSTRAATAFVQAVRHQLQVEVERRGERATQSRSYQQLQHRISPEALRRTWPNADVDAALEQ